MTMPTLPDVPGVQTKKAKRISWVSFAGAATATLWAGLAWAGVNAPEPFVSAFGSLAVIIAGWFDV